jgi:hypothetical protein
VSFLVTATLAAALAALLGGILMVRGRAAGPAAGTDDGSGGGPELPAGLGGLKAVIRAGDWRRALPSLLVLGGILGIMLFGSLALIFVFDQPRSGWPMCALAVLTVGWAVREYVRG